MTDTSTDESYPSQENQGPSFFTDQITGMRGGGIGIAGSHRVGKSTLCKLLHEKNPAIPFVQTSTRKIAEHFEFDVGMVGDYEHRLAFQDYVLTYHEALWSTHTTMFFTDRTPLDMAAYLLTFAPTGEVCPALDQRTSAYLKRCAEITDKYFMTVMVVQPGIPYVAEPGVPPVNIGYQEKMNALVIGLGRTRVKRPFYVMDRDLLDLGERAALATRIVSKELSNYQVLLQNLPKQ